MNRIFITSDTHFGHQNIIKYCNRPFKDADEMDEQIIKNWNQTVKKSDTVYHLGDFALGQLTTERISDLVNQLNGKIILILGNHDKNVEFYLECGFHTVIKGGIILRDFFLLSHKPMFMTDSMPYVNIHGHTHNTSMDPNAEGNYFNVSTDVTSFKPILLETIVNAFK